MHLHSVKTNQTSVYLKLCSHLAIMTGPYFVLGILWAVYFAWVILMGLFCHGIFWQCPVLWTANQPTCIFILLMVDFNCLSILIGIFGSYQWLHEGFIYGLDLILFTVDFNWRWFVNTFLEKMPAPKVSLYYNGLYKAMSKIKLKSVHSLTRLLGLEVSVLARQENFQRNN